MQTLAKIVAEQWRQMSWTEVVASLTGLLSVWLLVKNSIWNWSWGIISVILYAWVFWISKLYASAGLQILCFLPLSVYGWYAWAKFGPNHNDDLPIMRLSSRAWWNWLVVTALLCVLAGWLMRYTNDPAPWADGTVTAMSIIAQYLQARKWIQNWLLWIALDILSVGYLFPSQRLYITTALYVVFLVLCVQGYKEWGGVLRKKAAVHV